MNDTIVAISTPLGKGSIGIIRVSGNLTKKISKIITGKNLKDRYATYTNYFINKKKKIIIDYGISILFLKPKSFTGEDLLEIHSHGNLKIQNIIIKRIVKISTKIRIAKPGEFTKRAFINNKIDLTQAESIMDIINSKTKKSIACALSVNKGKFSNKIKKIILSITNIRVIIEVTMNFPETNVKYINNIKIILYKIKKIYKKLSLIIEKMKFNKKLNNEIKIILLGKVNVGKSSLINKLTKKKTSIVTKIPGTTRDIIKEYIYINKKKIRLIDTAGLRKNPSNIVESIGIKYTLNEINKSNCAIIVLNSKYTTKKNILNKYFRYKLNYNIKIPILMVINKIDLTNKKSKIENLNIKKNKKKIKVISLSAKKGYGLKLLKKTINCMFSSKKYNRNNTLLYKKRYIYNIKKSLVHLIKCKKLMLIKNNNANMEIVAEELKIVHKFLYYILGKNIKNNEFILEKIFSNFCIGK